MVDALVGLGPHGDATRTSLAEALEEPLLTADARLARSPGLGCEVIVTIDRGRREVRSAPTRNSR
jgi:hypothetical protein